MAEIKLTPGDDNYVQSEADRNNWNNVFGQAGNDSIKAYQSAVLGGPGNDTIEGLNYPNENYHHVAAAYWESPAGVQVDLQLGWALDGYGTRDTLINVDWVFGSGHDDWLRGNANDNQFWPQAGNDTIIGGAGLDIVSIDGFEPVRGQPWRNALLSDLNITVAIDGKSALITPKSGNSFSYQLTDVEQLSVRVVADGDRQNFQLADFITPQSMAEQGLVGAATQRWNAADALGTATTISYSFVSTAPASGEGSVGFRTFTASEKQAVRDILTATSKLAGLTFVEVTESAGNVGQMRFGANVQLATKGSAVMPDGGNGLGAVGDVWMDTDSLVNLSAGSEGYQALIHEIGHALGLRHPRNVDAGDAWAQQFRAVDDVTSNTVMSGTTSPDGLFRADWGPLDVAALRYLYGARGVNSGDTVYTFDATNGLAQRTLIDDGGTDTLDATASVLGVSIDLVPGHNSSVGFTAGGRAAQGNVSIAVGSMIENARGSAQDDVLLGNAMNNRLEGGLGNDWIDGGAGIDTAVFSGAMSDYSTSTSYGKTYVAAKDGVSGFDTLINIERLQFSNGTLALDLASTQNSGQAALLIGAVLGHTAVVTNSALMGVAVSLFDQGNSLQALSAAVMRLPIWDGLAGGSFNEQIANYLLTVVNGRAPTASELSTAVNSLRNDAQGSFLWHLAESPANQTQVDLVGLQQTGIVLT